jgi:hypothetical protein
MHNNFQNKFLYFFEESWTCWWCGMNTANAHHHIVGRGNGDSKVESSILNCAWLCNQKCHIAIHGRLRLEENIKLLLNKTFQILEKERYKLTELDKEFIKKYGKYYSEHDS